MSGVSIRSVALFTVLAAGCTADPAEDSPDQGVGGAGGGGQSAGSGGGGDGDGGTGVHGGSGGAGDLEGGAGGSGGVPLGGSVGGSGGSGPLGGTGGAGGEHIGDAGGELHSELPREENPEVPPADLPALVAGNTAFALDLLSALRDDEPGNLFFSPFSVSVALGMTWGGARGQTEADMATTMHFDLPQDRHHPAMNALDRILASRSALPDGAEGDPLQLNLANAIWGSVDRPFQPTFLDLLATHYGAGLRLLDFAGDPEAARITINDWVAAQTMQRILDLLPQGVITELTAMVLVNAIYFKASWETPFPPEATQPAAFETADGESVQVPTMAVTAELSYAVGEDFEAVSIPYLGHQVSMTIIEPTDAAAFEAGLDTERLEEITDALRQMPVTLHLPKFGATSAFSLKQVLGTMGMSVAFEDSADFSGLAAGPPLKITDVIHKAFVAIDETGTEAAAATAVIVGNDSEPPPPVEVAIDRPFLFLVRDDATGTVLFLGRMVDPR